MARKAAKAGGSKKRTVSGKRGKPGRKKQRGVDPRGVAGIVILCLGLLALASQFIPSTGGFLNQCMLIARGLGGTLCLLLPIVVCWVGVVLVFFAERRLSLRTLICGTLIFLFVETMFQLFQVNTVSAAIYADGNEITYGRFLTRSYFNASLDCKGGGLIGALLAWPLYRALDIWGAMIVLIFALTIMLMVLTGVSFGGVGMIVSQWMDDLRVGASERREERNALRAAREEEELERENAQALERQKKRIERAQAERRTRGQEEEEGTQEQEEEETPAPRPEPRASRRAKKPDLRVVRPQQEEEPGEAQNPNSEGGAWEYGGEETDVHEERTYEPLAMPVRPSVRAAAPRRRADVPDSMPLYIERDDEFTRESIEERHDAGEMRRRGRFTIREAEEAFLYGMNAVPSPQDPAQGQHEDPYRAYRRPSEEETAEWGGEKGEAGAYAREEEPGASAIAGTPDAQEEGEALQESEPAFGGSFGYSIAPRQSSVQEVSPEYEDEEAVVTAPVNRADTAAAGTWAASRNGSASRAPAPPPVTRTGQEGARPVNGAQPLVQLRGSRMDGTPLVVSGKKEHEEPQAMQEAYIFPPFDLLNRSRVTQDPNQRARDEAGAKKLLGTLESFGVQAKLVHVTHGPAITRYEIQPAPGVKVSRIVNLVDDIALNMASDGVRIEAPIPGKPAVGIEIPNQKIETVSLRDVLESQEMAREKSPTAVALGKGISGAPVVADMAKMPHVLIAGATGSGKSVCINTIINSIIYRASPRDVRLILIDPKVVELSVYNGIPHLLVPVVTDPKKASAALSWAVVEMEHRYKRFETMGVRDIRGYNAAIGADEEPMSKIIVIIDELADLMMVAPGEVEESICRLAQLARAAGIHLVIATQRPSVNVITGVIKANIPSRIAFAVSSQIDSRTILDSSGAEKLLGKGDMLYAPQGAGKPTRVQGCFVSDEEVQRIVEFVRGNHGADYNEDVIEQMNTAAEEDPAAASDSPGAGEPVDEMLAKAIELAVEAGQVSISMLQRRLRVGYARAGRLVDEMTMRGITAEAEGTTKPRTVLISREEWRRMQENQE